MKEAECKLVYFKMLDAIGNDLSKSEEELLEVMWNVIKDDKEALKLIFFSELEEFVKRFKAYTLAGELLKSMTNFTPKKN
jgi:hypothetical protein